MTGHDAVIIDTGCANLASISAALRRMNLHPRATRDPSETIETELVVLPGVGTFATAMDQLTATGLHNALRDRMAAQRPLLAICLGFQLLFQGSEESPGVAGLGVVPGVIRSVPSSDPQYRVPQLGWNLVKPATNCDLIAPGYAYFANSYCLFEPPVQWSVAWTTHGVRFVSAISRGPILGCQFHPELSGPWGRSLLSRWLAYSRGDNGC